MARAYSRPHGIPDYLASLCPPPYSHTHANTQINTIIIFPKHWASLSPVKVSLWNSSLAWASVSSTSRCAVSLRRYWRKRGSSMSLKVSILMVKMLPCLSSRRREKKKERRTEKEKKNQHRHIYIYKWRRITYFLAKISRIVIKTSQQLTGMPHNVCVTASIRQSPVAPFHITSHLSVWKKNTIMRSIEITNRHVRMYAYIYMGVYRGLSLWEFP